MSGRLEMDGKRHSNAGDLGEPRRAPFRSFGRRKGRRLRSGQAQLLEGALPRLALDLHHPAPETAAALFDPLVEDIRLEIGFGGGEHLVAEAVRYPRTGFVGCEPFVNGIAKALAAIDAHGLHNVRLHPGDALEVIAWLPAASLSGVDMLYPDPWPKRRHWKRRFITDATIVQIARVLKPGAAFRFGTDCADYATWTLLHFLRTPAFVWTAESADDWRQPWPEFPGTRYEAKARRAGHLPCYLVFQRV
jgi:tRNA (guanine-N7-)-methyltransferase